jgi:hypothetical protein
MFPFWIDVESGLLVQLAAFLAAGLGAWLATGVLRGSRV